MAKTAWLWRGNYSCAGFLCVNPGGLMWIVVKSLASGFDSLGQIELNTFERESHGWRGEDSGKYPQAPRKANRATLPFIINYPLNKTWAADIKRRVCWPVLQPFETAAQHNPSAIPGWDQLEDKLSFKQNFLTVWDLLKISRVGAIRAGWSLLVAVQEEATVPVTVAETTDHWSLEPNQFCSLCWQKSSVVSWNNIGFFFFFFFFGRLKT